MRSHAGSLVGLPSLPVVLWTSLPVVIWTFRLPFPVSLETGIHEVDFFLSVL